MAWRAAWLVVACLPFCGGEGEYIEDLARTAARPTFHMLLGVSQEGRLMSSNLAKAAWTDSLAMDFAAASEAAARAAPLLSGTVRIFVHSVPECAGEALLRRFVFDEGQGSDNFGWGLALGLHAQHMWAVHRAIVDSEYVTSEPSRATAFYIPAFPGLLVDDFIGTGDPEHLNCLAHMWHSLPEHLFLRNAGYDHLMVAGTCHPFTPCGTMECDVTTYHPFAGNVAMLVGGVRELGGADFAFEPSALYAHLRTIVVPFPVTLDCESLRQHAVAPRPVAVAFIGSENSRVRHLFRLAAEDPERGFVGDPRVVIQVLPDSVDGSAARRAALGSEDGPAESGVELYGRAEFCLVLPGHIYDLGRRGFDAMARGCLPVVVSTPPLHHVSVPFAWQVPWRDFAVFATAASADDAAGVISDLLAAAASPEGRARIAVRRAALLRHAPAVFLPPHSRCAPGARSALEGIVGELAARQAAWAALRAEQALGAGSRGHAEV